MPPSIAEPSAFFEPKVATYRVQALADAAIPILMGVPILPQVMILQPYQIQAIANWFASNGRGRLKIATGSGKTITALAIAPAPPSTNG